MPARALEDRSELSQVIARAFTLQHQVFAAEVANGASYPEAAASAGFAPTSGGTLMERPDMRARVAELVEQRLADQAEFGGLASRAWIESQIIAIIRASMLEVPPTPDVRGPDGKIVTPGDPGRQPNHDRALTALMHLAKLKGLIVDRSAKLNAKVDLAKLPRGQVAQILSGALQELSPAAKKKLEELTAAPDPDAAEDL